MADGISGAEDWRLETGARKSPKEKSPRSLLSFLSGLICSEKIITFLHQIKVFQLIDHCLILVK